MQSHALCLAPRQVHLKPGASQNSEPSSRWPVWPLKLYVTSEGNRSPPVLGQTEFSLTGARAWSSTGVVPIDRDRNFFFLKQIEIDGRNAGKPRTCVCTRGAQACCKEILSVSLQGIQAWLFTQSRQDAEHFGQSTLPLWALSRVPDIYHPKANSSMGQQTVKLNTTKKRISEVSFKIGSQEMARVLLVSLYQRGHITLTPPRPPFREAPRAPRWRASTLASRRLGRPSRRPLSHALGVRSPSPNWLAVTLHAGYGIQPTLWTSCSWDRMSNHGCSGFLIDFAGTWAVEELLKSNPQSFPYAMGTQQVLQLGESRWRKFPHHLL